MERAITLNRTQLLPSTPETMIYLLDKNLIPLIIKSGATLIAFRLVIKLKTEGNSTILISRVYQRYITITFFFQIRRLGPTRRTLIRAPAKPSYFSPIDIAYLMLSRTTWGK